MNVLKKSIIILICILLFVACGSEYADKKHTKENAVPEVNASYEYSYGVYVISGYDAQHLAYIPAIENIPTFGELYYADPYFLGEYFKDQHVEGGAVWTDKSKKCIEFGFTFDDGRGGAIAGPNISAILDLDKKDITLNICEFETMPFALEEMIEMGNTLAAIMRNAEDYIAVQ